MKAQVRKRNICIVYKYSSKCLTRNKIGKIKLLQEPQAKIYKERSNLAYRKPGL